MNRFQCNRTVIASLGLYTDGGVVFTGEPFVQCQSLTSSCPGTGFTTISQPTYCTDFSMTTQTSSGALNKKLILPLITNITVGYTGASWPSQIRMANGAQANNWRLITRINLRPRPDGFINSSPSKILIYYIVNFILCHLTVTAALPVIRVVEGQLAVIQLVATDWNTGDYLLCRWASSVGAAGDECGDVCNNLPNANITDR